MQAETLNTEYRKDWRNDKEFENDILLGHKAEKDIINSFANYLREVEGMKVIVEDNGVDNSGAFVAEDKVSTDADFLVNGQLIEVKFMNNLCKEFRFKKDQLRSYIKQDATVLFVNGWQTDEPVFTLMSPEKMKDISETRIARPFQPWGFKPCYFLKAFTFKWTKFEKVID